MNSLNEFHSEWLENFQKKNYLSKECIINKTGLRKKQSLEKIEYKTKKLIFDNNLIELELDTAKSDEFR